MNPLIRILLTIIIFYIDGNEIGEASDENSNDTVRYKEKDLLLVGMM